MGADQAASIWPAVYFAQALVAKEVAQVRDFGILDHLFRHLRWDEEHSAVAAEHHVPGHHRGLTDANRDVNADHGGIQTRPGTVIAGKAFIPKSIGTPKDVGSSFRIFRVIFSQSGL